MNRDAFERGMLLELEKLGAGGNPGPPPPSGSVQPAPTPSAPVGMGAPRVDRAPSKFRAGSASLLAQQDVARQEAKNLPGEWDLTKHWMGKKFTFDDTIKNKITEGIREHKPGEVVKPLTTEQMMNNDMVLNTPKYFDHAKREAANYAGERAWQTDITDMPDLRDSFKGGPNTPLHNALTRHVNYTDEGMAGVNDAVNYKSYGAFGVQPGANGMESKFTPGNVLGGNNLERFFGDHWGKLLAGGGLLAALMYALKGGGDGEEDDRRGARGGTTINNYGGGQPMNGQPMNGQPQFSRMPGYYQ